jgi:TATA-box binding protein (TBP) (component of TFIID and TFIIIB)
VVFYAWLEHASDQRTFREVMKRVIVRAKRTRPPAVDSIPRPLAVPVKSTPVKPASGIALYNHVCKARLVHRRFPDFVFNPILLVDTLCGAYVRNGFKCVTLNQRDPSVCCHTYQNGKAVACGAREEIQALHAIYLIRYALETKLNWSIDVTDYRVTNQVVSGALGFGLDLPAMSRVLGTACNYEPGVFPGMHYFPASPARKPCVLLYSSGAYCVVAMTGTHAVQRSAVILSMVPLFPVYEKRVSLLDRSMHPDRVSLATATYWPVHKLLSG